MNEITPQLAKLMVLTLMLEQAKRFRDCLPHTITHFTVEERKLIVEAWDNEVNNLQANYNYQEKLCK